MNGTGRPALSVIMVDGSFREAFHAVDFFARQTFDNFELIWVEYYDDVNPVLDTSSPAGVTSGPSPFIVPASITRHLASTLVSERVQARSYWWSRTETWPWRATSSSRVWEEHAENEKLVMYVHRRNEPREQHVAEVTLEHLRLVARVTNPENYGACLTVRKKWLLAINGYEQHWVFGHGAHANGRDVYTRLKNLGLHIQWHPEL